MSSVITVSGLLCLMQLVIRADVLTSLTDELKVAAAQYAAHLVVDKYTDNKSTGSSAKRQRAIAVLTKKKISSRKKKRDADRFMKISFLNEFVLRLESRCSLLQDLA